MQLLSNKPSGRFNALKKGRFFFVLEFCAWLLRCVYIYMYLFITRPREGGVGVRIRNGAVTCDRYMGGENTYCRLPLPAMCVDGGAKRTIIFLFVISNGWRCCLRLLGGCLYLLTTYYCMHLASHGNKQTTAANERAGPGAAGAASERAAEGRGDGARPSFRSAGEQAGVGHLESALHVRQELAGLERGQVAGSQVRRRRRRRRLLAMLQYLVGEGFSFLPEGEAATTVAGV